MHHAIAYTNTLSFSLIDGWTPLTWAKNNAHEDIVKLLQDHGAALTSAIKDGLTKPGASVGSSTSTASYMADPTTLPSDMNTYSSNYSAALNVGTGFYSSATPDLYGLDDELYQTVGAGLGSGLVSARPTMLDQFSQGLNREAERWFGASFNAKSPSTESSGSYHSPRRSMESYRQSNAADDDDDDDQNGANGPAESFVWDKCLPTQMFVVDPRQLDNILTVVVDHMTVPHGTRSPRWMKMAPANTIFLGARYAHYFAGSDLLVGLLEGYIQRVRKVVKFKTNDLSYMAFWLANTAYLLHYLRRDTGLLQATVKQQREVQTLLEEIYQMLLTDAKARLSKVLTSAMLDYESIPGGEQVKYERPGRSHKLQRSSKEKLNASSRASSSSSLKEAPPSALAPTAADQPKSGLFSSALSYFQKPSATATETFGQLWNSLASATTRPPPPQTLSPRTVTTILSSILFVMQCYEVPEYLQGQLLAHVFQSINDSLITTLLQDTPSTVTSLHGPTKAGRLCSRWSAVCIRMNVSVLEDWVRTHTASSASELPTEVDAGGRKKSPTSPTYMKSGKRSFEGLLKPLHTVHADDIVFEFEPLVATIQLLQIASTTFSAAMEPQQLALMLLSTSGREADLHLLESRLQQQSTGSVASTAVQSAIKQGLFDLADAFVSPSAGRGRPGAMTVQRLSIAQLQRLLISNYRYERGEPVIDESVARFLEETMTALQSLQDRTSQSVTSMIQSVKQKLVVSMVMDDSQQKVASDLLKDSSSAAKELVLSGAPVSEVLAGLLKEKGRAASERSVEWSSATAICHFNDTNEVYHVNRIEVPEWVTEKLNKQPAQ